MNRKTAAKGGGGGGAGSTASPVRASPAVGPRTSSGAAGFKTSLSSSPTTANALQTLANSYADNTPPRLKLIDAFCVFLIILGVMQFAYCVLVTNFPFNSFMAGFGATVGQFVLAASLRIQANRANDPDFKGMSPERAFADFVFGSLVLHFFVFNFLG